METPKIQHLRIVFAVISYLLGIFSVQLSNAQPPFHPQSKPMLKMDGQGFYWSFSHLGLTEAQKKTLESLLRAYVSEALPLRIKLMSSRLELLHSIRDPDVQPKILLDRQKKISEHQANLNNLLLSYLIKARSILTKEQLEQLYEDYSQLQSLDLE
jgi:hypothetical protein